MRTKSRIRLGLAAAAVVLAAPALPQSMPPDRLPPRKFELVSAEVVVPFELVKGRPVVPVRIDGKGPFPFVLDTGAGGTVLEAELAKELALSVLGEARIGDPIQPHAIAAKQVEIQPLSVGGAAFSKYAATAMETTGFSEYLGARGVLGMPVFAELLLTIDYGKSEVRISRGELPSPDEKEVLAYRADPHGTIRVPITVGTTTLDADLDSGSPGGVSLPEEYMEKLSLEGKPVEIGRARTVNSEFVVHGATLRGALTIGSFRLEHPQLRFHALPPNLGGDLLRRFALTIDQKNRRIRFHETAIPDETPAPAPAATSTSG
jgi:hypothetical protein